MPETTTLIDALEQAGYRTRTALRYRGEDRPVHVHDIYSIQTGQLCASLETEEAWRWLHSQKEAFE